MPRTTKNKKEKSVPKKKGTSDGFNEPDRKNKRKKKDITKKKDEATQRADATNEQMIITTENG